jgi:hypothetical protein
MFVGWVEITQCYHNGIAKHFLSWENLNDSLFLWLNLIQVVFKLWFMESGRNIIPDWTATGDATLSLIDTNEIVSFKGGSG